MNVSAARLVEEFGFTERHWVRMAAAGRVPGVDSRSAKIKLGLRPDRRETVVGIDLEDRARAANAYRRGQT